MIVGLAGPAGCGKSTAAAYLAEYHGFARIRFAGPLKAMLRTFLEQAGVAPAEIERMIEGDRKESPADVLGGRSPRYAMQRLGSEFGRDLIHPDLWTRAWRASAEAASARGAHGIVAEDCRFANEAAAIRAVGGIVVRIERTVAARLDGLAHASETPDFVPDLLMRNDGDVDTLADALDRLMRDRAQAWA